MKVDLNEPVRRKFSASAGCPQLADCTQSADHPANASHRTT
jgi:hypothetical protein